MRYLAAGFPPYFAQDCFQSHWQVTQRCNFHCPYCVNESLRRDGLHMPQEIMRTALRRIAALRHAEYRFSISGGEVTLYPHLEEMLTCIADQFPARSRVNLLTNGSASVQRLRRLLEIAGDLACRFIITIHLGQTNIKELARKLQEFSDMERKQHFHVKMVVPPADPQAAEALALLDAAGIACTRHAVIDFATGKLAEGYTTEELDALAAQDRSPWFYYRHIFAGERERERAGCQFSGRRAQGHVSLHRHVLCSGPSIHISGRIRSRRQGAVLRAHALHHSGKESLRGSGLRNAQPLYGTALHLYAIYQSAQMA